MFGVIEEIRRRASANAKKIVFPESDDRRILQAAEAISRHRIASPITLGEPARIKDRARQAGVQALHVEVRQPELRKIDAYAKMLAAEWRAQGIREVEVRRKLKDPTQYAAAMVRFGDADGLIAGPPGKEREAVSVRATHPTRPHDEHVRIRQFHVSEIKRKRRHSNVDPALTGAARVEDRLDFCGRESTAENLNLIDQTVEESYKLPFASGQCRLGAVCRLRCCAGRRRAADHLARSSTISLAT